MKSASIGVLTSLLSTSVVAQTVNFDADVVGAAPSGWTCGVTGRGSPRSRARRAAPTSCASREAAPSPGAYAPARR